MGDRAYLKVNNIEVYRWRDISPYKQVKILFNNYSFVKKWGTFRLNISTAINRLRLLICNEDKAKLKFESQWFPVNKDEFNEFKEMIILDTVDDSDYEYWVHFKYSSYKKVIFNSCVKGEENQEIKFLMNKFKETNDSPNDSVGYESTEDFSLFLYTICLVCSPKDKLSLNIEDQIDAEYYPEINSVVNTNNQWYIEYEEYPIENYQTLVLTEGKSDSEILRKTLNKNFKDYSDLISFEEFGQFNPAGGASYLEKYVQFLSNLTKFLMSAGTKEKVIALFDNDYEGIKQIKKIKTYPNNFVIDHYPDRPFAKHYQVENNGKTLQKNINGRGLFLELYIAENICSKQMPELICKQSNGIEKYHLKNKKDKDALKRRYDKLLSDGPILKNKVGVNAIIWYVLEKSMNCKY
ncbi:hypothetical protein [Levilactobacillus enshiensis]|uniref:hypothetical protein n=1 Tax=Levilactobacillus enshiensis TaxID=2590213 RepID=UPI00117AA8A1|nr:hypothetical protein [Levilactobacillus enshiensis]